MFNPPSPLARLPFRRPIPPHAFKTIIFCISYFVFFFLPIRFFFRLLFSQNSKAMLRAWDLFEVVVEDEI